MLSSISGDLGIALGRMLDRDRGCEDRLECLPEAVDVLRDVGFAAEQGPEQRNGQRPVGHHRVGELSDEMVHAVTRVWPLGGEWV